MHQNYGPKNIDHRARSRAKDHRNSLPGPFIGKTTPCSRARLFARLRDFFAQYRMRTEESP